MSEQGDPGGSGRGVLVIGGGPAGLMAAETCLEGGVPVTLVEAKPSFGRKFLMAGKSGLNLTKIEPEDRFLACYGPAAQRLRPILRDFGPEAVRDWTEALGQATFVGSTGRLFPRAMKASPLLRAWLARLDGLGLDRRTRWRWTGWEDATCRFETPQGERMIRRGAVVLALGGASWARLGSDGAWAEILCGAGVDVRPFRPANAGVAVAWSEHMVPHFGTPLKSVRLSAGDLSSRGEVVISARGLEGGGVYPLNPALRQSAPLVLDLAPDLSQEAVAGRLARRRGKASLSTHLRKRLGLGRAAQALLRDCAHPLPQTPEPLAAVIKALPIGHDGLRPLDEAISVAGGVAWPALDDRLMLTARPGTFCAGEMIDWEAPTGGYLLTACLATGRQAGSQAADWVSRGG